MNVVFYTWNKSYKRDLCFAMAEGARKVGHNRRVLGIFEKVEDNADVAVLIGCNRGTRLAFDAYRSAGKHVVYVDKGYLRYREQGMKTPREYHRIAVDCFQPASYVMDLGDDESRWEREKIKPWPWRVDGDHIIYADSSNKYKEWFDIDDEDVSEELWKLRWSTTKTIVYRPRNCEASIYDFLTSAWALVTRGSNAAVDALLYGVPVLLTGDDCVSAPLASRGMVNDQVFVPSDEDRHRWLCGLAWCQYTPEELESGFAWRKINERLEQ